MYDRSEKESDVSDRASLEEMLGVEEGIFAARKELRAMPTYTVCRNGCGDAPLPGGGFCSTHCRDEFEEVTRMSLIQGKKVI